MPRLRRTITLLSGLTFLAVLIACGGGNKPVATVTPTTDPSTPAPEGPPGLNTRAELDGVGVTLTKRTIGPLDTKGIAGAKTSADDLLILTVTIDTARADRRYTYRTWRDSDRAVVVDNLGNRYPGIRLPLGRDPVGGVSSGSVYKDASLTDVLVFPKPVEAAQSLTVTLPGSTLGVSGEFQFRVPVR